MADLTAAEQLKEERADLQEERANLPYYASKSASTDLEEDMEMPEDGISSGYCLRKIEDYHTLDFSERLNASSFVNVVFEPEEEEAALLGLKVNLADQTVYPESFRMHNDVVNMVAKLWHCPKPVDFDDYGCYAGAGTVGSTEACLLAGLALKFRWRAWYSQKYGLDGEQVLGVYPNLVITTCHQSAWTKLFKYMDIQPRFISPSSRTFTMDPAELEGVVDEKTIGVVCIMGNHFGGQYDPVWEVDRELEAINRSRGLRVGIHVDAASGGFVAPFQELPAWDFRLKSVLSISASGHKFGNSCCGTGWVIWRERKGLSDGVAINVSYLGGSADSYTLNFSRPAQSVYVQFYKFLRLGHSGYQSQVDNQMEVAQYIREHLLQFKKNGKSLFMIMDAMGQISPDGHPWQRRREACLPMVTAMFNRELGLEYDEVDLQHAVAQGHWFVGSYTMSMQHPVTRKTTPIFKDQSVGDSMFRIVVKSNMTKHMAANLVHEIHSAVEFLDTHPNNAITAKRPRIAKKIPGAAWAADHIKEWAHKAASFVADAHGA